LGFESSYHTNLRYAATFFLRHSPARRCAAVQFRRLLHGQKDELLGFEQSLVRIEDPGVVATSGKTHHPIVKFNGRNDSRVSGTLFEITDAELASADRYEVATYKRVAAMLASGKKAWVYVDARFAPGAS
jgi:Gamma-glutamyl cyclotransferase, AIG2-like